jgi:hypothetical protein
MRTVIGSAVCLACGIAPAAAQTSGPARVPAVRAAYAQNPPPPQPPRPGPRGRAGQRPGGAPDEIPDMGPRQVQDMLDAYALVQAETFLQLTDQQYGRFVPQLRRLQGLRRRQLQERLRLLNELRGLLPGPGAVADEAAVTAKIKEVDDFLVKAAEDVRLAYQAIDQTLNLRQRARFRMFEEQMERKKLDLIARARAQAGGGEAPQQPSIR